MSFYYINTNTGIDVSIPLNMGYAIMKMVIKMGNVTLSREVMKELDSMKGRGSHSDTIMRLIKRYKRKRKDVEFAESWDKFHAELIPQFEMVEKRIIDSDLRSAIYETTTYKDLLTLTKAFLRSEIKEYYELPDLY
jgi:predicted CopG family antitoxin